MKARMRQKELDLVEKLFDSSAVLPKKQLGKLF